MWNWVQANQCSINGFNIQHLLRNIFSAKRGIKKNFLKHDKNVTHTKSVINIILDEKFDIFSLRSVTRQRGFFSPFLFNTIGQ